MAARAPLPAPLRPYVGSVWVGHGSVTRREHVVPSAHMHLAVRIDGPPLRLFAGDDDDRGEPVAHAVVCGARSRYYAKQTAPGCTAGALLLPGASGALFGLSAAALAGRHVPLRELWGADADALHAALAHATGADARLAVLEQALLARLRPVPPLPGYLADAIAALERFADVGPVLAQAGCSHRHFIAGFRDATGLAPKCFARLRRFQRLLAEVSDAAVTDWSALALAHGYCDQAHLARDFRQFVGLPARRYLRARRNLRHVTRG